MNDITLNMNEPNMLDIDKVDMFKDKLEKNIIWPTVGFFQNKTHPIIRHFGERFFHVVCIPLVAISSIADGIFGMKEVMKYLIKGRTDVPTNIFDNRFESFENCLSLAFVHTIAILNLNPAIRKVRLTNPAQQPPRISFEGHGLLTNHLVYNKLRRVAENSKYDCSIVLAKFIYIVMIPTAIITRIFDLAIGILAAVGALCTFGTQASVNHLAFRGLQITGIFFDIYYCSERIINVHLR